MPAFLCSGNSVVDVMVRPVEGVRWGETAMVDSLEHHVGGNGANTSYTLARLGNRVRLLAPVGHDSMGELVLSYLGEGGVDVSRMRRTKAPTGATIGLVGRDGARSFLHCLGASGEIFIQPDELRAEAAGFTHYHLGAPFRLTRMRPVMPGLLRAARDAGLSTSLDTQWDADGRWMEDIGPCLPHTDVFFANEDEFRMLTGSTDPAAAARCLRAAGASTVVLKLGGRGCAVYNDAGETRCPAYDVPVLDTTGAGDCFAGGFLHAWARRAEVMEAARFASAVAALCVQSLGATEGVRSLEETLTWMQAARPLPAQ